MRHAPARLLAVVAAGGLTLLGVWLAGGVLTDDAALAMVLTGAWFVVAGAVAGAVALRFRPVRWAVLGGWAVTAALAGGFLLLTSSVGRTVDEDVLRVEASGGPTTAAPDPSPGPGGWHCWSSCRPVAACSHSPGSRPARDPTCGSTCCRQVVVPTTRSTWVG